MSSEVHKMGFKFINTFNGQPVGSSLGNGPLGGSCTGGVTIGNMNIHHHGPNPTTITGAYDANSGQYFNGYQAAILDAYGKTWRR